MIHYHGLPITPATAAVRAVSGGHAFVSFRHPEQLTIALEVAQSFAIDNGAFSAWRSGQPITDWSLFYEWVGELHRYGLRQRHRAAAPVFGGEPMNYLLVRLAIDLMHKSLTFFLDKFFSSASGCRVCIVNHCSLAGRFCPFNAHYSAGANKQINYVNQNDSNAKTTNKVFHMKLSFYKNYILALCASYP